MASLTGDAPGRYAEASTMLSRFRPVGRRLAWLLVALLIGATALPPALHADMDDLACEFGAARSARAAHLDANDTHDGSLHCEVCHWLRSIRVFEGALSAAPQLVATIDVVDPPKVARLATAVVAVRSSRGPPLS
jgi:hypothetical protein